MTEYPSHVAVIEDDPKRPYKAYASTALTAVAAFVTFWIADADPFTAKEAAQGGLVALVSAGLIGGTTFAVRNPKRGRDLTDDRGAGELLQVAIVTIGVTLGVLLAFALRAWL